MSLREEARRPVNFWLRLLAAGVVITIFVLLVWTVDNSGPFLGQILFQTLNQSMLLVFWLVVPLMTADCVSRERREGTLGLLFLTPLTARDVVLGKAGTHALRAPDVVCCRCAGAGFAGGSGRGALALASERPPPTSQRRAPGHRGGLVLPPARAEAPSR